MAEREKTQLELALAQNVHYASARESGASSKELQEVLDRISDDVCGALSPDAILAHTHVVYEETAPIYAGHPDHLNIPDELLLFMDILPNGAEFVLDLGCGAGRDAVFMALTNPSIRKKFMGRMKNGKTTAERLGVPSRSFYVSGVDSSLQMLHLARGLASACGLRVENEVAAHAEFISIVDMHRLREYESMKGMFDGVWSSAALFMHTPEALIAPALAGVAHTLMHEGIFGVSYANVSLGVSYNNLRHSRTGEIKYFSRPSRELVIARAADVGLQFLSEFYSDLHVGSDVKKDFFVTQFFQKSLILEPSSPCMTAFSCKKHRYASR